MFIAWVGGKQLLEDHAQELRQGQYKVVLFFLIPEFNEDALKDVVDLAVELDQMTGASCLAIAFMPPPDDRKRIVERYRPGMLPSIDSTNWPKFTEAMTRATYGIADYFNIEYKYLPCLLFFSLESGDEFAIAELRDGRIRDILRNLRRLFSDWALENKDSIAIERARLALGNPPGNVTQSISPSTKTSVREINELYVIPLLEDALLKSIKSRSGRGRAAGIVNNLRANPFSLSEFEKYLKNKQLSITVDGIELTSSNLRAAYDQLYLQVASRELADILKNARTPIVPFPLERARRIGNGIIIRKFKNASGAVLSGATKLLELLDGLRKLGAPPFVG